MFLFNVRHYKLFVMFDLDSDHGTLWISSADFEITNDIVENADPGDIFKPLISTGRNAVDDYVMEFR